MIARTASEKPRLTNLLKSRDFPNQEIGHTLSRREFQPADGVYTVKSLNRYCGLY